MSKPMKWSSDYYYVTPIISAHVVFGIKATTSNLSTYQRSAYSSHIHNFWYLYAFIVILISYSYYSYSKFEVLIVLILNPFRYDLIKKNCAKIYIVRCSHQLFTRMKSYTLATISSRQAILTVNNMWSWYVIFSQVTKVLLNSVH